jgi:glutaminase
MENIDIILKKIYDKVKKIKGGKNASYIPELAKVDPKIYSISICDVNGNVHNIGDYNKEVAIESVAIFVKKLVHRVVFYHLIL